MGFTNRLVATTILLALAAVSMTVPSAAQSFSEQAKAQLTVGEQFLQAGDLSKAQTELQKVIDSYPGTEWTWWARVHLSTCYYRQKRHEECILEARKVVNLYPSQAPQLAAAWSQLNIGLAYEGKGDVDSAIWEFERVGEVLGAHPDHGPLLSAKCHLALIRHGRNERKKALDLGKEIMADPKASDKDRAWACFIIGSALVGDKKSEEGLSELKKVKDLYQVYPEQLLAAERKIFETKYIARHDYDGMIKEGKTLADTPNIDELRTRQVRYFVVLAYLYKKDYNSTLAEAQAFIDKYTKPGDDLVQVYSLKARALAMKKDYAQAVKCLEAALALKPSTTEICATIEWDIATCYRAMGDSPSANACYQRLIVLYPDSHLALRAAREMGQ